MSGATQREAPDRTSRSNVVKPGEVDCLLNIRKCEYDVGKPLAPVDIIVDRRNNMAKQRNGAHCTITDRGNGFHTEEKGIDKRTVTCAFNATVLDKISQRKKNINQDKKTTGKNQKPRPRQSQ